MVDNMVFQRMMTVIRINNRYVFSDYGIFRVIYVIFYCVINIACKSNKYDKLTRLKLNRALVK